MEYNNQTLNEYLSQRLGALELENLQLRAVVEHQRQLINELKAKGADDGLQDNQVE